MIIHKIENRSLHFTRDFYTTASYMTACLINDDRGGTVMPKLGDARNIVFMLPKIGSFILDPLQEFIAIRVKFKTIVIEAVLIYMSLAY